MAKKNSHDILTYEEALPQPELMPEAGERVLSHYLITEMIPITDSGNQAQRLFAKPVIHVGDIDTANFRAVVSSLPTSNAPVIVDDVLYVNGHAHGSYAGVTADPKAHLGQNPSVCYQPVEAIDITGDLRRDGYWFFQLADVGGHTYCSSRLYLRIIRR